MYIYLFIVWLVELECKLRIIVWNFKCISDLYGIIEVERVWKYDNWIIEIMFENIVLWKLLFLMVIIKFKIVRIKICYNINF